MNQRINVGNEKVSVFCHPNAPIVINQIVNGKYNTNRLKMRYSSIEGYLWLLQYLQENSKTNVHWYVASDAEYIETLSEYMDYPIEDIKHDIELCANEIDNPLFMHMIDAYKMIVAANDLLNNR